MPSPPIRVLIVDDDPLVRSALTLMLGGQPDLEVVGEAADGRAGVALARRAAARRGADGHPDAACSTASTATRELHARPDPPRVIVLTTFDADELRARARSPPAPTGSCSRTPRRREIVEAIRKVAAGDPMLSPSVTRTPDPTRSQRRPARPHRRRRAGRLDGLTEREREVALAVGRGLSNAEIAAELYLSVPTVKAHVSRLFDKLGVTNRVQIAICVHDAGLV